MPLDLLVPDLVPPSDATPAMLSTRLPALEKWLARADVSRVEVRSASDWLAAAFALPMPAPVAPIALAAEGADAQGSWSRADPVHVRIERGRSALHPAAALDISRDEADALVGSLQAHFRADGMQWLAPSPERWYVGVAQSELPATVSLDEVLGRDLQKMLPVSKGTINWASAMTEAQMLLAANEVNAQRERDGRPAINSVWFWGAGAVPARPESGYARIYADEIFARGLAMVTGTDLDPVPAEPSGLKDASAHERILVVLDKATRSVWRGDEAQWTQEALELDRAWFARMGDCLARFSTVRVIMPGPTGTTLAAIHRHARWRLLRLRKPLAAYG